MNHAAPERSATRIGAVLMRAPAMTRPRGAFTLLETILVIVLVGVIAAVGVPRMVESADKRQLLAEARRLAADLNLVRARAASTSLAYRIVFDTERGQYSITPDDAERAARIQEGRTSIDGAEGPTGAEVAIDLASVSRTQMLGTVRGVSIERLDLGGSQEILFTGFGAPDRGGLIVLARGKYAVTITIEKDRGTVSIGPVTRTANDSDSITYPATVNPDATGDPQSQDYPGGVQVTAGDLELQLLTGDSLLNVTTTDTQLRVGGTP